MWQEYCRPNTLKEALEILARHRGQARVIAGGTDLVLDLKNGNKRAEVLVDVRKIAGMEAILETGDKIFIGAGVTHAQLAANKIVRKKITALAQAAQAVGSHQIRNVGTLGGNVVNAQPAADTAVALAAFEGEAEILSTDGGKQAVLVENLYAGRGRSIIDSTRSILTGFYISAASRYLSGFDRVARRKSLALPVLNLAVALRRENRVIRDIRIAAGPIGPRPERLRQVEQLLAGRVVTPALLDEAADLISQTANPRDSVLRGSREYRRNLLGVMLKRTLTDLATRTE